MTNEHPRPSCNDSAMTQDHFAIITRLSDGRWTDDLGQGTEEANRFPTWVEACRAAQELRAVGFTELEVVSVNLLDRILG